VAKKAPNNLGSSRQRPDGRWECRISLPDGRRKSFYAETQKEAIAKANKWNRDRELGLDADSAKRTVKQFLSEWIENTAKQRVRPSTYASYKSHITQHLIPVLGRTRLRNLSVPQVNAMLSALVASGMNPTTANLIRATLRTSLTSAVKWGLVTQNVAGLSDARRMRRERIKPLTIEQARALLVFTRDDRIGMLIHVAIHSGMRQGELLALRWEDVDLDAGELHVRHTLTKVAGKLTLTDPKTEQSQRSIRLTTTAVGALRTQLERVHDLERGAAHRWQENDLVFPSTIGTYLNNSNVTHRFQELLEAAGLPRQRFHDLRHCTASILLAEGMDLFTVKEVLGHSQISLTANTYGHLTRKLADEAAMRMDRAFMGMLVGIESDPKFDPSLERLTPENTPDPIAPDDPELTRLVGNRRNGGTK